MVLQRPYTPGSEEGRSTLQGALVASVEPDSAAAAAGIAPGYRILSLDGEPLRDAIDWAWFTSTDEMEATYIDEQGAQRTVTLEKDPDEPWGIELAELVFDKIMSCKNACTFCFVRMLPEGLRPSLYVRDDDYRLSFYSGTFATLTNIDEDDERRIIERHISPLHVSLHAVTPAVREDLMGHRAPHGIAVLERLLDAGIVCRCQIVLVPGVNDGDELAATLGWAYAHEGIQSIGIVPLGFTSHQRAFDRSFDDPSEARAILEALVPFQAKALEERGHPWVFAADEFYRNAFGSDLLEHLPEAGFYGEYDLFEDGIGIIRSVVDDWRCAQEEGAIQRCVEAAQRAGKRIHLVCGEAQREFLEALIHESSIAETFVPLYVPNDFFGGNVDVTGLLVGEDIASAIQEAAACDPRAVFFIPRVVFNDDGLMLDDLTLSDLERLTGAMVYVVSCSPLEYFDEIADLVGSDAKE